MGFWPLSIVRKSKKTRSHDVSETGSASVLRCSGRETPTVLGPLDRANLSHWTLNMRPIRCPETSVKDYHSTLQDFLTLEDGTDTLSRNVGKGLPFNAAGLLDP
jgi:hypothetical protein